MSANGLNCEFQQFAWQWFLDLTSPVTADSDERNFEDTKKHPILGVNPCPDSGEALLSEDSLGLGIRITKPEAPAPFPFILPKDIEQAGSGDPLFDQQGNVVYYNIRYTPNECKVNPNNLDASFPNTPPNTVTELKTAWRQIDQSEADRFFTAEGTIVGPGDVEQTLLLGLVGFHMVKNSPNHQEFIWATFEHKDNAPVCNPATEELPPSAGWSFASTTCAACLATPYSGDCPATLQNCNFNHYPGDFKPTEVCRASANGNGNLTNQLNITSLERPVGWTRWLLDPVTQYRSYGGVRELLPCRDPVAQESDLGPSAVDSRWLDQFGEYGHGNLCSTPRVGPGADGSDLGKKLFYLPQFQRRREHRNAEPHPADFGRAVDRMKTR